MYQCTLKVAIYLVIFLNVVFQSKPSLAVLTKNQFRQCVQRSGATKADISLIKQKKLPESLESKCLLSCILESEGLMKNAMYNKKIGRKVGLRAYPKNKDKTNKALQILEDCGERGLIKTKDPCEAAYQLALCTSSLSDQLKL